MNENENKVTERNVQAEHSNASANNAMVDDSAAAAASNELNALRAALQRTQQALARVEHEVEQLRTQATDTKIQQGRRPHCRNRNHNRLQQGRRHHHQRTRLTRLQR